MPHPKTLKKPIKNSPSNGTPIKTPTTNNRPPKNSGKSHKPTNSSLTKLNERHTTPMALTLPATELPSIFIAQTTSLNTSLKTLGLITTRTKTSSEDSLEKREKKEALDLSRCSMMTISFQEVSEKVSEVVSVQVHLAALLLEVQGEFQNPRAQ